MNGSKIDLAARRIFQRGHERLTHTVLEVLRVGVHRQTAQHQQEQNKERAHRPREETQGAVPGWTACGSRRGGRHGIGAGLLVWIVRGQQGHQGVSPVFRMRTSPLSRRDLSH